MIIYKTTNLIDGKFYVGKSIHNNPDYFGSGLLLVRAIKKYGIHNFKKEILEFCIDIKHLNEREIFWIRETKAQELGYNIADGGHGGNTYNEEIAKRVSEKFKGRKISKETIEKRRQTRALNPEKYKHSPEDRARIGSYHKGKTLSQEHIDRITKLGKERKVFSKEFLEQQKRDKRGANSPFYGKKHTEETRKKMSEAKKRNPNKPMLGKKLSEEHKKKISESGKGRVWSEEQRKKYTGQGASFYGKKHKDESKQKISEAYKNRTVEQKLEKYIRFYFSRTGKYPSAEQEAKKLRQYLGENQ